MYWQGYDIRLQIDGGVTVDNIKEVRESVCLCHDVSNPDRRIKND